MSRVGKKAMTQLRKRLSRGGKPSDGILLRRDLVEALVADIEAQMLDTTKRQE